MFSILSNTLRHTLYATTLFAILDVGQLLLISLFFPKAEAATFALFVCTATLVGKGLDSGLGAASPRLLKIFRPTLLVRLGLRQGIILLGIVGTALCFYSPSFYFFLLIAGTAEAISSFGRHALYSSLQGTSLAYTEVAIKALKVATLPFLFFLSTSASSSLLVLHYLFFAGINTFLILLFFYKKIVTPSLKTSPHPVPSRPHYRLLTTRLQLFSIKIGKDLLSTFVLTPLFFAATHNSSATWFFFFFTTLITSLQTIIKMTIAYTASGAFSKTSSRHHPDIRKNLNKTLWLFLSIAIFILISIYSSFSYFLSPSPQAALTAHYTFYFALLGFADLLPVVEEQYLLIKGVYTFYQKIRFTEYAIAALLIFLPIVSPGFTLTTIAFLLLLTKIILLIFLAARSSLLTKPPMPAPIFTPPVTQPPQGLPPLHTHEPTSPRAPTQKEGQDGGVPRPSTPN